MGMIISSWSLIDSLRWKLWHPARRESQPRTPLSSYLNVFGFILGSHRPLFQIDTLGSKMTKSTAFHPHTYGQTEVVNRIILHILIMYNYKHPHTCYESLLYVQHRHNRYLHNSIIHNHFQVRLVLQPLAPIDVALPIVVS
jgi:hypothetical protein